MTENPPMPISVKMMMPESSMISGSSARLGNSTRPTTPPTMPPINTGSLSRLTMYW